MIEAHIQRRLSLLRLAPCVCLILRARQPVRASMSRLHLTSPGQYLATWATHTSRRFGPSAPSDGAPRSGIAADHNADIKIREFEHGHHSRAYHGARGCRYHAKLHEYWRKIYHGRRTSLRPPASLKHSSTPGLVGVCRASTISP